MINAAQRDGGLPNENELSGFRWAKPPEGEGDYCLKYGRGLTALSFRRTS
jgi:hypothetical protein